MKARVWGMEAGYAVTVFDEFGRVFSINKFTNEFAAQTYADAINTGVIQHEI